MTMKEHSKEEIIQKVQALLARAGDEASTESEAMMAARQAAKLMDEYKISAAEVDSAQEAYASKTIRPDTKWQELFMDLITTSVGLYTGVFGFRRSYAEGSSKKEYVFYGEEADLIFAEYLANTLLQFVLRGVKQDVQARGLKGQPMQLHRRSYLFGAGQRIAKRLRDLVAERNYRYQGTNLPALADSQAVARQHFLASHSGKLTKGRGLSVSVDPDAFAAGEARGDQARFERGVGGGSKTAALPG